MTLLKSLQRLFILVRPYSRLGTFALGLILQRSVHRYNDDDAFSPFSNC
jgi:hypothetical protein